MENLEASFNEHQKIEQLKKWFKQYGNKLLMLILVLAVAFAGFQYWQRQKVVQADAASQIYLQLLEAVNKSDAAGTQAVANELMQHYASTPYAKIAAFALAQNAVRAKKMDEAANQLRWVMNHPDQVFLSQLAKIRLAQVLLSQAQAKEALAVLSGAEKIYPAETAMLKGQALLALGKREEARSELQKAIDATPAEVAMRPVLQMYLMDI